MEHNCRGRGARQGVWWKNLPWSGGGGERDHYVRGNPGPSMGLRLTILLLVRESNFIGVLI
jgi:hypothetical protein